MVCEVTVTYITARVCVCVCAGREGVVIGLAYGHMPKYGYGSNHPPKDL